MMSLDWGDVLSSLLKQKLNVMISTEGELVGANDGLGVLL